MVEQDKGPNITLQGILQSYNTHAREQWLLTRESDGALYELLSGPPRDASTGLALPAGATVNLTCVTAINLDGVCLNSTQAVLVRSPATVPSSQLRISLLVVIISIAPSPDCSGGGADPTRVQAAFWSPGGYAAQLANCSYGSVTLVRTGFRIVSVSLPCSSELLNCNAAAVANEATDAARAIIGGLGGFTHRMYVMPNLATCPWGGLATLRGRDSWMMPSVWGIFRRGTVMQELLHNLGLHHAWRDGIEYADISTWMGFGEACPTAPELARLGWATPLAAGTLDRSNLLEGMVIRGLRLNATYLGPNGTFIRIRPDWMGDARTINVYVSLRAWGRGDSLLPDTLVGRLSVHEALSKVDDNPGSTDDPRINLLRTMDPGTRHVLPALRLAIQARELVDEGTGMLVDICRFRVNASECRFPLVPTACPRVTGFTARADANHYGDDLGWQGDPESTAFACNNYGTTECDGFVWDTTIQLGIFKSNVSWDGPLAFVSTGFYHTCVKLAAVGGPLKCFGLNSEAQLGIGDTLDRGNRTSDMGSALREVSLGYHNATLAAQRASAVVAGEGFTCALLQPGSEVKCWGSNVHGQCGIGFTGSNRFIGDALLEMGANLTAIDFGRMTPVALAAGRFHACALLVPGGVVRCWGLNTYFSTGYNTSTVLKPGPPVDLGKGLSAIYLAAGWQHTCAVLQPGGLVKCWGQNDYGQLGQGDIATRGDSAGEMGDALRPVELGGSGDNRVRAERVVAGDKFTCALLQGGAVKCWGRNEDGSLGLGDGLPHGSLNGTMGDALPAVNLGNGVVATALAAGRTFACALLNSSDVKCWGNNAYGQLGLGNTTRRGTSPGQMGDNLPTVNLGAPGAVEWISAGAWHACAMLRPDARVKCWGYNLYGQLGLGHSRAVGDDPGEMGTPLPAIALT
ncbi:hypothetical protein HYH03_013177 [Edaphochlamys debaryana]|uniref:Peptidase M11 gametolysin domain-containing protein n=1 Tax=Edaphochlamys debaryana TaxID=47281 RepID=A0A835XNT0_9CHLO|nr:hypothetical protein HYH03_013177 [Edaphochlamys debaryana]|eukprot:KAG2488327.1 hypothetical protein HYH03_013177 [Edaphochlamys debaryana]